MQHSEAVREAALAFYRLVSSGGPALADAVTSDPDAALIIGTDPTQWEQGRDTVLAAFAAQADAIEGLSMEPGDLRAFEEGTIGWIDDRPTFVFPDGTRIRTRHTAVFRNEGGQWRLVSSHVSIGVPDEELPAG